MSSGLAQWELKAKISSVLGDARDQTHPLSFRIGYLREALRCALEITDEEALAHACQQIGCTAFAIGDLWGDT